jgi:hypothetical protein
MRVSELLEMLRDQPPDAEVELAVVAPVDDEHEDITVDRYTVEGMLPWTDDDSDEIVIWLVGGDDDDVEAFLDAIENAEDDDHDHDGHSHDGHTHGDHTHPH